MRALRCPIAIGLFALAAVFGAVTSSHAQTWVRTGDILFDSFGTVAHDAEPLGRGQSTALVSGETAGDSPGDWNSEASAPDVLPTEIGASLYVPPSYVPPSPSAVSAPTCRRGWHLLPGTLLYQSYLAGEKEPRIGLSVLNDSKRGWLWEAALGGRLGIIRRGDPGLRPVNAWQIDIEGAALARVNPTEASTPLEATDYRIGLQWTKRTGPTAYKAGYYHISSHVGDEFLLANPGFNRINYVRDSLLFGIMHDVTPDAQIYGEIGYGLGVSGGAEPLEFQFGAQYLPVADSGLRGSPFAAVNVHLREEVGFGGGINVMAGWRWRGPQSGRLLRIGLQYYNGKSIQYEFLNQDQQLIGYGIWADF